MLKKTYFNEGKNGRFRVIDRFRLGKAKYLQTGIRVKGGKIEWLKFCYRHDNYSYYRSRGHSTKVIVKEDGLKFETSHPDFVKDKLKEKARVYYKLLAKNGYIDISNNNENSILFEKEFLGKIGSYSYNKIVVRKSKKEGIKLEGKLCSTNGRYIEFWWDGERIDKSYSFIKSGWENKLKRWIKAAINKAK